MEAFNKGRDDYRKAKNLSNPYPKSTSEYIEYESGWYQARKMYPLVMEEILRHERNLQLSIEDEKCKSREIIENMKREYLRAKKGE